ncbi:hypothetical protein [Streptomyces sp. TLI_105]|uniref:hypothetical protein n=1 Tax=Streptomyces sp. TLI_105 TaxID=1881019 RepID=UPI000899CD42|nr:hypothetical protein [Streptomyces sp. TLI_105]SEC78231.1 hypothetical protein SAMN05428939_3266 [Streptomyces sp. TLI_105]
MAWVVGAGMLLGVLSVVLGVVTFRMSWVPPWSRGRVTRPRLMGAGAVLTGLAAFLPGLVYFGVLRGLSWEARFFGQLALMLSGIVCIGLSQLPGPSRGRAPHTTV